MKDRIINYVSDDMNRKRNVKAKNRFNFRHNKIYKQNHVLKSNSINNKNQLQYSKLLSILFFGMIILVLMITGFVQNLLYTEIQIRNIVLDGVNYEEFRNIRITEEHLKQAEDTVTAIQKKYPKLDQNILVDKISFITFCMLANNYDLIEHNPVHKNVYIRGIGRISKTESFQELYRYNKAIFTDLMNFPVPLMAFEEKDISYVDTWLALRQYGGNRRHEGTDLMDPKNTRGRIPVLSITDGTVEKLGWLEQGGNRIGIRSTNGGYFYYAHLDSYAPGINVGDPIIAGQLLGFMGDSGYGPPGTVGMFDVHLHMGIYVDSNIGEMSVNPYWILKMLEDYRTKYTND